MVFILSVSSREKNLSVNWKYDSVVVGAEGTAFACMAKRNESGWQRMLNRE